MYFPLGPMLNYGPSWRPSLIWCGPEKHNFLRGPLKDYCAQVWFQFAKQFKRRRFFNVFPIGSNVKLYPPLAAILYLAWTGKT